MNLFISVPFDIVLLKVLKCVIRTNIWSLLLVFLHPPSPEIHLCSERMKVVLLQRIFSAGAFWFSFVPKLSGYRMAS